MRLWRRRSSSQPQVRWWPARPAIQDSSPATPPPVNPAHTASFQMEQVLPHTSNKLFINWMRVFSALHKCFHNKVACLTYAQWHICYIFSECSECPAGMEPVVGFEYKWWNRMPSSMKSSVFSIEYSSTDRTTGKYHLTLFNAETCPWLPLRPIKLTNNTFRMHNILQVIRVLFEQAGRLQVNMSIQHRAIRTLTSCCWRSKYLVTGEQMNHMIKLPLLVTTTS